MLFKLKSFNKYKKPIFLVITAGILLRFILSFFAMPAGDGCWHLNVARFIARNGGFPLFENLGREVFARPPLYHIISSFFYRIFDFLGNWEIGLKLISPIFGSLIIIFTYLLVSKLFNNKKIIFWSVFFVSFLPLHVHFSSISHTDILISFFTILTVFFLVNKNYILTGVSFGLAMLSKYSGPFLFLVILFYLFWNLKPKEFLKKSLMIAIIGFIIAFPWYLRNWIILGNPVWPMLRFIFGGYKAEVFRAITPGFNIFNLFSKDWLIQLYAGLFGVPQGSIGALGLIPFKKIFLPIWVLSTIIFISPLIVFFVKKKNATRWRLFYLWIFTFLLVALIFLMLSSFYPRLILPVIPAVGVLWAFGLNNIPKYAKYLKVVLIIIVIGFIGSEFFRTTYASNQWQYYMNDFDWVKSNTEKDATFFADGQCFSYYMDRATISSYFFDEPEKIDNPVLLDKNISYVWLNQRFKPDPISKLKEEVLDGLYLQNRVYLNNITGTEIYKLD